MSFLRFQNIIPVISTVTDFSTIFELNETDLSTILKYLEHLLASFNALNAAQQQALISYSSLTEQQKQLCDTMASLSANTGQAAEQEITVTANPNAEAFDELQGIVTEKVTGGVLSVAETLWDGLNIPIPFSALTTAADIAVKAFDAFTTTVDEQKMIMESSVSAYEAAKNEAAGVTAELENQQQLLEDLLAKDKLTYTEEGQLEDLQDTTRELRIQQDLTNMAETQTRKESAEDASDLFQKQFADYELSDDNIKTYQDEIRNSPGGAPTYAYGNQNDIGKMIAAYIECKKQLEKLPASADEGLRENLQSSLYNLGTDLLNDAEAMKQQQEAMSDYYNEIKDLSADELTDEQQGIIENYERIPEMIDFIHEKLDPENWNAIQINDIFSTEGLETTKEEIIEMAKSGTLDENTIQSYTNLSAALADNNLSAKEFLQIIEELANAKPEIQSDSIKDTAEDYDHSAQTISDASDNIDSSQSALDNLATKENNAASASQNLANATQNESSALTDEINASAIAGSYLNNLSASKLSLANTRIDTSADINAIIAIANAAGMSIGYVESLRKALQNLLSAKTHVQKIEANAEIPTAQKEIYLNYIKTKETEAQQTADNLLSQIDLNNLSPTVPSTPPAGSATPSTPTPAAEPDKIEEQPFEKVIDWIERRLESFKNKFDKWVKQAESAVTAGFVSRYYKKASKSLKQEMSGYGDNYNYYMQKANEVGLDERFAQKVRNGTIEIETITDKALADQIEKYQEYYDKAGEAMTSFVEAAEKFYRLPLEKAAAKIDLFKDKIDLLGKRLDNAIGFKKKNKLINKQLKQEKNTRKANKTANKEAGKSLKSARSAMKKKTSAFLKADKKEVTDKNLLKTTSKSNQSMIKKAVKNGKEIDLSKLKKGSELYQKAKQYNASLKTNASVKNKKEIDISKYKEGSSAYNAAVKYNEALKAKTQAQYNYDVSKEDYKSQLIEASKAKFDNIANDYEKKIQTIENKMSALDNEISQIEAAGKRVDKSLYESKKSQNDEKLAKLQAEKAALEANMKKLAESKDTKSIVNTDAWYDMLDQIQQISDEISNCITETYELNNAINELHFAIFDDVSKSIGNIISEQEFLQGLLAHEKNADQETGDLTEAGLAKLGSLSASRHAAKNRAERTGAEVRELQRMKESGSLHSDTLGITFNSANDLEAKLSELYGQWQDDIKETYSIESEIADIMKDKYQAQLDLMKDLIDAKKESLNAEKDLHDYKRSIQEKTKDITTIQKQIAAYSGDTSQEGLAKLQKLQKELADKQDDLREAEYDRYVSDQQDMLDTLYQEYEELVTKKLDDFQGLVDEGLAMANEHAASISGYLSSVTETHGYMEETKGLFIGLGSDIKTNVDRVISAIAAKENVTEKGSGGAAENPPAQGGSNSGSSKGNTAKAGSQQQGKAASSTKSSKATLREKVKKYIKKHASDTKTKKEEFSAVNQKIYDNKSNAYKGTGKILSSDEMKGLAKTLNIKYNGEDKDKNLYKKLKNIDFPGFKKGGIVSVSGLKKQIRQNGDDGLASVSNGEAILTPKQTELFQKFTEQMPAMAARAATLANQSHADLAAASAGRLPAVSKSLSNVVNIDSVTLPNVTNYEEFKKQMFHDMQNDKKYIGFVKDVSIHRIAGAGVLEKNRRRF